MKSIGWAGLGFLAMAACTAPSTEDVGEDEGAKKIDPTDDETTARLVVDLPDPLSASWGNQLFVDHTANSLGLPISLTAGKHCVGMYSLLGNAQMHDCDVALTKGTTTHYVISEIEMTLDPNFLAVNFGPRPMVEVTPPGWLGVPWSNPNGTTLGVHGKYARRLFARGSDVNLQNYDLETSTFTVNSEHEKVNLLPSDIRGALSLDIETAELGDDGANGSFPGVEYVTTWKSASYVDDALALDPATWKASGVRGAFSSVDFFGSSLNVDGSGGTQVFHGLPAQGADTDYALVAGGFVHRLKVAKGATEKVKLGRIDVSDVIITDKTTGEKRAVAGTFLVERKFSSTWVAPQLGGQEVHATQHGLWVPEGDYRVTVSYDAGDGLKKKYYYLTVN